jgi:medium-chain acyl-[acyl-carrier-protein] hydrolase
VRRAPRDKASLRLFCLPYAGAGSVVFRDWSADFPAMIDVCAIEPPGRLARHSEPLIKDAHAFAAALEAAIDPYLDRPFAFFGYSLGALMSFECARRIRRHRQLEPTRMIVAAHKAPQCPHRLPAISQEPSHAFMTELERRYGPFEPAIKADAQLLHMVVKIMRADLSMFENYRYQEQEAFGCPVLAIGGTEDLTVLREDLESWGAHTRSAFRAEWLQGGHFFLHNRGAELRALVRAELVSAVAAKAARA